MKKFLSDRKYIFAAAVLLCLLSTYAISALGAGTVQDPLVTLSYINGTYRDELVKSVMDSVDESFFSDLKAQIRSEMYDEVISDIKQGIADGKIDLEVNAEGSAEYEVICLKCGESVRALGSCELILRSGSGRAFVEKQENIDAGVGLSDCTDGSEITDGMDVPSVICS